MKIAFLPGGCAPFHDRSLGERPLGGMPTAVIGLARALDAAGAEVTVLSALDSVPPGRPRYLPRARHGELGAVDVLVAVRDWRLVFGSVDARRRWLWTGDSHEHVATVGLGDRRVAARLDRLLAVSDWHAATLCRASGFPRAKCVVLRNGLDLARFAGREPRARKRLVYASAPFRGLALLPAVVAALAPRHPDLELAVFSGPELYAGAPEPAAGADFATLAARLGALPGFRVHGAVTQDRLARELMRASVLAYPNTYTETSCIVALEAQAAGCAIVTSRRGALPETVGAAGLLVDGEPGSPQYLDAFCAATERLLTDDALCQRLADAGRAQAAACGWERRAARFLELAEHNLAA